MKPTIYLDTSVPSAYFDDRAPERQKQTREFWKKLPKYDPFISDIVFEEIKRIKNNEKKNHLLELVGGFEKLTLDDECKQLAEEYISKGIFSEKNKEDALHIAVASVNAIDYLVSWNFEHIVKLKTRRMVQFVI